MLSTSVLNDACKYICTFSLLLFLGPSLVSGNVHYLDHTTNRQWPSLISNQPVSFEGYNITNCSFVVVRSFLKEQCFVNGKPYFKCPFSNTYYRVLVMKCRHQVFTHVCENDTTFYQSCGHFICSSPDLNGKSPGVGVCGEIVCGDYSMVGGISYETYARNLIYGETSLDRCNGVNDCTNKIDGTSVDERMCNKTENNTDLFLCTPNDIFSRAVNSVNVCDGHCDCDQNCHDEANCFNWSVGLICRMKYRGYWGGYDYVPPRSICDAQEDCMRGIDEQNCETGEVCHSDTYSLIVRNLSRSLNSKNKCGVADKREIYRVCSDYSDQMNCTDDVSLISPLLCDIKGFATTLSQHVICKNLSLCDDGIDSKCVQLDNSCTVHKHRMCDFKHDCQLKFDESNYICGNFIEDFYCIRRLSPMKLFMRFPSDWVLDGVKDCASGIDEDPTRWHKQCGTGIINKFVTLKSQPFNCTLVTLLKCPRDGNFHLVIDDVCNTSSNCDYSLCLASRQAHQVNRLTAIDNHVTRLKRRITLFFCLPGLQSLQRSIGLCEDFKLNRREIAKGISDSTVIASNSIFAAGINCFDIFGELFIYLICTGQCVPSAECPLNKTIPPTSCGNYRSEDRAMTITESGFLTVVLKKSDQSFHQDIFSCVNENCIPLHNVCNLQDDCGDASDEVGCSNNFRCKSGEFIPLSRKCNGNFDCLDFSDECNDHCDNQVKIFKHISLSIVAWVTGAASVLLNAFVLWKNSRELKNSSTSVAKENNCLMTVISLGDFLQGAFIMLVAAADRFINKSTCITQFKWTTSFTCNFLGVISTTGSQISLLSMTLLSVKRAKGIRSLVRPSKDLSIKSLITLAIQITVVFALALIVAIIPLTSITEEIFVSSLAYENNLFVGKVDKARHIKILEVYYGRFSKSNHTWKLIRKLVAEMFINTSVEGSKIGFYGSNGFCLFNYFVRKENLEKFFSGTVLMFNLTCVLVIAISYLTVNISAMKSSTVAGVQNKAVLKRNKAIQRKVAILIATDILSWVPFIITTIAHFFKILDASSWYGVFSIIILPCNCLINPLMILEKEVRYIGKHCTTTLCLIRDKFMFFTNRNAVENISMDHN